MSFDRIIPTGDLSTRHSAVRQIQALCQPSAVGLGRCQLALSAFPEHPIFNPAQKRGNTRFLGGRAWNCPETDGVSIHLRLILSRTFTR